MEKFCSKLRFGMLKEILLVLVIIMEVGCVKMELDRQAGTAFPPSINLDGETVDLSSIYKNVNIELEVVEDDIIGGGITPEGLTCYTDAELDTIESGHRDSSVGPECMGLVCEYQVYGVIVDGLSNGDGSLPCEPCTTDGGLCTAGAMWKTDNRSAFAIFYQHPRIQSNPGFFLLTAAHEFGHTLGLHHQDGNEDLDNPSIMNAGGFFSFTNGNYEFSEQNKDHLTNHPGDCKWPGTGSFWAITPEHAERPFHASYDQECN